MKFILIFIFSLISGLSFGLKGSSHHYKFKYFSSFKSEIPQDGDQASGVSLKAVLDVYLENNDGIAIFKLSDVTTVEFLEKLESDQDTEFSEDRFETPTDKVFLNALQQPFRVNLRGSQPFAIEYEETEERWLSNVRKGIASVFKNEILKGNFETQDEKDSISSLFREGHLVNIFSVEEETIFGICKVTYEIHEINEGLITPENEFFSSLKIDSNEDLWRVVRSVDFDKCKEKVILNINSLNEKRNKGQKPKYTRSSVSTYLLSGSPGHFDLRGVVVEGVMTYPLSFFDEHEAHSSTKQKLILIDQGPNEELPTLGPNLKQSTTWLYVVWSPFTQPKDGKPLPWIVYSNENVFNQPNEMYGSRPFTSDHISQLKVQILKDIETASKVLTDINYETKDSLWRTISDTLNMVTYYFKMLSKEDIIKIFDHIYERKVKLEWRLIIDAAAASGSHNAFEAIFDYISADKLKPYQIRNIFLTLGSSEGTLNITRILDYVLNVNLVGNDAGAAVWINFAHYLKEFCIHKTHNYIPVKELFYEDCALVVGRFKQNLHDVIYNETLTWERTFAVKVLEVLQIDTSFNILTPLFHETNKAPNELKTMALRALKNSHPDRDSTQSLLRKPAMDLLKEVYSDFNQDIQVRAAALLSFISWQPSTNFWNKLAQNTWNDPSKDFSSFSSNLINLYANKKFPAPEKQWKDAYYASKLAKPSSYHYDDSSSSLFNFFFKDYAKLILGVNEKIPPSFENFFFEILTKENDLSLLKFENYALFSKAYEMPKSGTPHYEFFTKFMKEIGYDYNYYDKFKTSQNFFQILGGALNTQSQHRSFDPFNLEEDAEDGSIYCGGRFLKLVESTDFFPNELGLPTFTFGSIPVTFSFTSKRNFPRKPGQVFSNQYLVKASAIHTRGVGVYLPWSFKSHNAMIQSSLEYNIPVRTMKESYPETEGMVRTFKTRFNIGFEKKFPALRLSKTPMTITYYFDPVSHNPVINFVPIKKSDIEEKVISEVDPFTGIKYDLNLRADTKSDFGLNDFLKFPKVPFGFWSFEFYINPEESETKEIIFAISHGTLRKSEETTESFDSKQYLATISNSDTMTERSEKLTKAFGESLDYSGFEFSFVGKKERNYEFFVTNNYGSNLTSRRMIGVTRSQIPGRSSQPASLCFKMSKKIPSAAEMNSVFISKTNISQEIKIKLLYNCSQPILKAHALYSMSDEGKDETTKKCNSKYSNCKYDNTGFYSKKKLFYDTIDIDAFYATNTESFDLAVTENILDSLRNWVDLSSIKKFTDATHLGNITLRIHRNTYHKNWDIHLKTPSTNVLLATYPDTPLFTFFSGVTQYQPIALLDMFNRDGTFTDAKCILQRNSVKTFDGVHYIYEPSTCWTLAYHTRARWYRVEDKSVLLIRAAKKPSKILEFKYRSFALGFEIEFSNEELKVEGTVVDRLYDDSPDLRTIEEGIIYKIGHSYHIYSFTIPTRNRETFNVQSPHIIVYDDKIEIYNENLEEFQANGICGNNDGRMISEFIGPKNCIYNDAQMFAASWTGQSDHCDAATLEEFRKGVDHFQAECKAYQKNIQDVQMNERCLVFQWKISTFNETNYCISAKPLPFCL